MHPLLNPDLGLIVWTAVAFFIVLFLLRKFAWKPILSSLNEREASIADSLATAQRVKAEMAQLQSENEALLVKAREERTMMLKEAKETRDKIVGEAKEQAREEASKIIAEAQVAINNQKMAALVDVKNQVGTLALEVAEKVLRTQLSTTAEHEKYIREITQLSNFNQN
ncbi:MAG: ATP synthase F0 subunit B [Bacteroidetes bacterium]|nr:MAG: ATP synthase F0 subunit B [Bacteroidota bacterium]